MKIAVIGAGLSGTDLTLGIHSAILRDLENSRRPSPYLKGLVRDGNLGFKSNQGFKSWTDEKKNALRRLFLQHFIKINQLFGT